MPLASAAALSSLLRDVTSLARLFASSWLFSSAPLHEASACFAPSRAPAAAASCSDSESLSLLASPTLPSCALHSRPSASSADRRATFPFSASSSALSRLLSPSSSPRRARDSDADASDALTSDSDTAHLGQQSVMVHSLLSWTQPAARRREARSSSATVARDTPALPPHHDRGRGGGAASAAEGTWRLLSSESMSMSVSPPVRMQGSTRPESHSTVT
mmetsp:Transcript_10129/g.24984  ORF Transcript_10129/g.24984 Transcript_10129/m.24984 type:complete len:218 (-) Transcript_10129:228-881(-)